MFHLTDDEGSGSVVRFGAVTVGYDQRLSIWEIALSSSPIVEGGGSLPVTSSPLPQTNMSIKWLSGSAVNASDIATLDLMKHPKPGYSCEVLCAVVGEGLQLFSLLQGL